jgi:hypothetical protein
MILDVGAGYLPNFIRDEILPNLPRRSGEGIHRALYDLARVLAPYRTVAEREVILHRYASQCDRHVPESEIADALRCGALHAWKPNGYASCGDGEGSEALRAAPGAFDLKAFRKFIADAPRIDAEWLVRRSPSRVDDQNPVTFLAAIFRRGEKALIFDDVRTQGYVWTHWGPWCAPHSLDRFVCGRPCGMWFLINPSDARFRINGARRWSRRSAGNIVSWRYLLVESDRPDISPDEWLTALVRLELPIVSIVETGDRLPHALIHVGAENKEQWDAKRDELRPDLVRIGADVASLSRVQLSRLPGCYRYGREDADGVYRQFPDGPRVQRLLFLNPGGVPITAL